MYLGSSRFLLGLVDQLDLWTPEPFFEKIQILELCYFHSLLMLNKNISLCRTKATSEQNMSIHQKASRNVTEQPDRKKAEVQYFCNVKENEEAKLVVFRRSLIMWAIERSN